MKIELLFPDACYLGGDIANAEYLCACIPGSELIKTGINDTPRFMTEKIDAVLLGNMTERAQLLARDALRPCLGRIRELIEGGTLFLITGNAVEVFGRYIEFDGERREDMLGLFGYHAECRMMNRHNSLFVGKFEDTDIVGFRSQFGHCFETSAAPLFEMSRGIGFEPKSKTEGVRVNNFFATYLLGPLLVMNPPFTKKLLKILGAETKLKFEDAAMDAYEYRLNEFRRPELNVFD